MIKLFRGDLKRMVRDKTTYICFAITMVLGFASIFLSMLLLSYGDGDITDEGISSLLSSDLFGAVQPYGQGLLVVATVSSIKIVSEFKTGAIRDKMVIGYKRKQILGSYALSFSVFAVVSLLFSLIGHLLSNSIVSLYTGLPINIDVGHLIGFFLLSVLSFLMNILLCNSLVILTKGKTLSILLAVLVATALAAVAVYVPVDSMVIDFIPLLWPMFVATSFYDPEYLWFTIFGIIAFISIIFNITFLIFRRYDIQ